MPTILSKPTVAAFTVGLAVVAGAIRKAGNKAAGGEQRKSGASAKLFVVPKGGKDRVGINKRFLLKLSKILKLLVPGVLTPEAFYMALVAVLMVRRSATAASPRAHAIHAWCVHVTDAHAVARRVLVPIHRLCARTVTCG